MHLFVLRRFRHLVSRPGRHRQRPKGFEALAAFPGLEILEGRVLLDAVRWINPAGGAWEVAANWDAGRTPGPDDDAVIDLQRVTVSHSDGNDSVHSLELTGSRLSLAGGTLGVATDVTGTGTLVLSGGALAGATVAAGLTFQNSRGTLDHVTTNADLNFTGQSASLQVVDGLVVNGTIFLAGRAGTTSGAIVFRNTQTVRGHGRIDLGAGLMDIFGGSTVTLGRNLTITGTEAWINASASEGNRLINKGTIIKEGSGGDFILEHCINEGTITTQGGRVALDDLTNAGTITATGGMVYVGPVTNTGTITATGGGLELAGWTNYGVVSAGGTGIVRLDTGTNAGGILYASDRGTFDLGGTVTNTGNTLTLMGSSVLTLEDLGTLSGGTVTGSGTVQLQFGTLDAVTVDTDVYVYHISGDLPVIRNGLTLNGTLYLTGDLGSFVYLIFDGTQRIDGHGTIVFQGSFGGIIYLDGDNSVLTLGPGLTVRGTTGYWQGVHDLANERFVNEGTIVADGPGAGLVLTDFTNRGTIAATNGRITMTGTWSNDGLLSADAGGTLTFDGRFINTGQTLTLSGPGTYRLAGTIVGGTVAGAPLLATYATLDGVTLDDNLDLAAVGGLVTVEDGLTLNGTAYLGNTAGTTRGTLSFVATQMVDGSGGIVLNNGGLSLNAPNITVTLGAQLTIRGGPHGSLGASQMGSHFVNDGTIVSDGSRFSMLIYDCTNQGMIRASDGSNLDIDSTSVNAGGTIVVGPNSYLGGGYTQTSGVTILDNGEIDVGAGGVVDIQGGTLTGSGLIVGNVRNAGVLAVGSPGVAGRLTIRGDYTQSAAGALRLEIGGRNAGVDFDQLVVTGQASLGGTLAVALVNGFVPAHGDTFQVLTAGSLQGTFTTLDLDPAFLDPQYAASGVTLAGR
jgi:hypothetical protein